jgi:hypothetical protein
MPRFIVMDELHIQVSVPVRATADIRPLIRRRLKSQPFRRQVVASIRALFADLPPTAIIRVRLVP